MIVALPDIGEKALADITIGERIRPVSEAAVVALVTVIDQYGFTVPILIRRKKSGFVLIDGAHRLEAMRRRGAERTPVVAVTCTDAEARGLEISQNLAGASMTPLDDALFLAAFRRVHLELHPETSRGVAGALSRWGATDILSFASVMADKRGISVRQVQRIAAAGDKLTRADAEQLRRSPRRVTSTDIEAIGRIGDPDERAAVIEALAEGKKAAAARKVFAAAKNGLSPAVKDPVEEGFKALRALWGRVPQRARRRFAEHFAADLREFIDGAGGEGRA
ncbi:MAG: ParB N-terminal domain-containing protein [Pseudorhodobacter sp.]|nr:ParB N-terminal domain-containing protein [Pseudorhodobacter sp.]